MRCIELAFDTVVTTLHSSPSCLCIIEFALNCFVVEMVCHIALVAVSLTDRRADVIGETATTAAGLQLSCQLHVRAFLCQSAESVWKGDFFFGHQP